MATDGVDSRFDSPDAYGGRYPPDWGERRRAVYRRDDYTCQRCGAQSGPHASGDGVPLHAHHVVPLSEGGSNQLSNLLTLCERCHDEAHDHDVAALDPRAPADVTPTPHQSNFVEWRVADALRGLLSWRAAGSAVGSLLALAAYASALDRVASTLGQGVIGSLAIGVLALLGAAVAGVVPRLVVPGYAVALVAMALGAGAGNSTPTLLVRVATLAPLVAALAGLLGQQSAARD